MITVSSTIPTQPACRLCHTNYETYSVNVNADQNGNTNYGETVDLHGYNINGQAVGYSASGLTVYANDYQSETVSEATDGAYPDNNGNVGVRGPDQVKQTAIHRIDPNSGTGKINVQNFGACFACHSVQLFHASPIPDSDYTPGSSSDDDSVPYDTLRYAPGRSVFNLIRGSNNDTQTWNNHRVSDEAFNRAWQNARGENLLKSGSNTWNWGSISGWQQYSVPGHADFTNYESLSGMTDTGSLYSGLGGGIVAFTDTPTKPTLDTITVSYAYYFGGTVEVHAYSSIGSGQSMSFTYTGGGCGTTRGARDRERSRHGGAGGARRP